MLVGDDVEPDVVAEQVLVHALLEEPGGDGGITVCARQAATHGVGARQDVVRDERIRVLAQVPGLHQEDKNATTRSTKASGCSISG